MCKHQRQRGSIGSRLTRQPPHTAGEKARDIIQLLNCYLQVSPTAGGCDDGGGNALEVHSYMYTFTHTQIYFRLGESRPLAVPP